MAPPPKKQKIVHNEEGQSAIIFHQPGLKPDVLLRVFDVDYHVHSIILKPHSAFFRKFLEPSNTPAIKPATVGTEFHELSGTITPASASATSVNLLPPSFRYVWITKIDHDDPGKWHLTSKYSDEKENVSSSLILTGLVSQFTGDAEYQKLAFQKLLCAIYSRRYTIESTAQLQVMIELADYYWYFLPVYFEEKYAPGLFEMIADMMSSALPKLSTTLDGALVNSPKFCATIRDNCAILYVAAVKLRNALLFRESLIWVVGPHRNPLFRTISDAHLRMVARCVHGKISSEINIVNENLLQEFADDWDSEWENEKDAKFLSTVNDCALLGQFEGGVTKALAVPAYYQSIFTYAEEMLDNKRAELLRGLLKSNLILDRSAYEAGEGDLMDNFLCAKIADEDLPWDITETDW